MKILLPLALLGAMACSSRSGSGLECDDIEYYSTTTVDFTRAEGTRVDELRLAAGDWTTDCSLTAHDGGASGGAPTCGPRDMIPVKVDGSKVVAALTTGKKTTFVTIEAYAAGTLVQRWDVTGLSLTACRPNDECATYCANGEVAVTEGDPSFRSITPSAP